jgi:hypothetical protein
VPGNSKYDALRIYMFIHLLETVFVLERTKMVTTAFVLLYITRLDVTQKTWLLSQTEMDTLTTPRVVNRPYVLQPVAVRPVKFVTVTDYQYICLFMIKSVGLYDLKYF